MALYRIDVENGSDKGSVKPDAGWRYNKLLNQVNEADLKFSGTGEIMRSLLVIGSTVYIYKNGTLDFKGLIDTTDYFVGGTVVFHASGWEVWLAKEQGTYANSPWSNPQVASATIFSEIIAESSKLNVGTVEAGFSTDYRLTTSQTLWNAMSNLANKTTQDVSIDYTASPVEISILDHTGSATSVAVLNEGKEITNVRKSQGYPRGNSIIVKGKGDGDNQITGTATDATSIAAYGTITKTIVDRSIMTTAEATSLADAELALNKDSPIIYDFDLTNPDYTGIALGDVITLNALDQDITNDEVRIVGIEEGEINGKNKITFQTTNPELKTLMLTKNKVMAQIQKSQTDNNTYMQGAGNLSQWEGMINGNNTAGLRFVFSIGDRFEDEAGNLRIDSLTVDYDVDEYRKGIGTATESNKAPDIDSSTHSGQDNESTEVAEDNDYDNNDQVGNSWANYQSYTNIAEHGEAIIFHIQLTVYDWNDSDTNSAWGRIKHVDETDYYPSSSGVRLLRGLTEETTDSDTHNHGGTITTAGHLHAYNTGTYYQARVYNAAGDDYGYVTYTEDEDDSATIPNDSHSHTSYSQLNGSATIYIPGDPYGQDYNIELDTSADGNATCAYWFTYYVVSQHKHGSGDYKTDDHKHDVSIGDGVSDAGSVNATSVNIYLDFYNTGTSTWDNKHSVTSTGKTLDREVDLTDSGTYPDAKGFWRIRILTNNASPDLIQGIVNVKHALDN